MLNWIQQNLPLLIVLLSFGASGLGWVFKQAEEARKRKAADQARERARLEALRTGTFQSRAPTAQPASGGGGAERSQRVLTPRERIEELSRRRQQSEASQRDRRRQELEAQLQRRREAAEAQRRQRTATQSSTQQTPSRGTQRQPTAPKNPQRPAQSPYQTPSQSQQRQGKQASQTQVRAPSQGQGTAGPRSAKSAQSGTALPRQARQPVRRGRQASDESPYAIGSGRLPTESDGAPEVASLPSLRASAPATSPRLSLGGGMGGLSRAELRRGVILREVFDLPLALRAPIEGSGF